MPHPSCWFLRLALPFGLLYALLAPPFQAPDETSHFYRAYHLSEGYWMGVQKDGQRLGGELPASLTAFYRPFAALRYNYDARTSPEAIRRAMAIPLRPEQRTFVDFANTGFYAPTSYAPYAIVFALLKPFKPGPGWFFYAGRLAGLVFWVFVLFHAIRLLPYHRWAITFSVLLPASLFLHASLSGDTVINAVAFYLIAWLLALAFDGTRQEFGWRQGVGLLGLSAVLSLGKVVYAPLIALYWLIPKRKFGSAKDYWLWGAGLMAFNAALLAVWYYYSGGLFIPYDDYGPAFREGQQLNPGVDPPGQLAYILERPLYFAQVVAGSYLDSLPATLAHYAGKFGWEHNYLPTPFIALLLLTLLALAAFEQGAPEELNLRRRSFLLALAGVMCLALATVLYMLWQAVGDSRIVVLMGRYFIPIFPLLWLALPQRRFILPQRPLQGWALALLAATLAWGAWAVLQRYY
ncbi:MAG: DUF2142 domain-containing protein [Phaeodactylibacter sp.]|nr:DUF2142 domain-containing protein [Phaeodactylibacter sp.]MCB9275613.1 DUF2142 domain-containing protein [Lewinellaceae bacterium]